MKRTTLEKDLIRNYAKKIISELSVDTNQDVICDICDAMFLKLEYLVAEVLWGFYDAVRG